jgi:hypothetical protein
VWSTLSEVNHQLESRMRETRLSGSEGGGTLVLPTPISEWHSQTFSRPESLPVLGGGNESLDQFRSDEIAFELVQLGQPEVIS